MSLNNLKPFELGESGSKEALFFLEKYIINGTDNEKRLSASAIRKLATEHNLKPECNKLIPLLITNLENPKPQVRQYTLKALLALDINTSHLSFIQKIIKFDDKYYNIELAEELMKKICNDNNTNSDSIKYNSPDFANTNTTSNKQSNFANTPIYNSKFQTTNNKRKTNLDEKGYVYIIKESFYGMYKIGKAKNLGERLNLFNVQLPFDIKLIHVIWDRNYGVIEQLLHMHFDNKRTNGEWFNLNSDDIAWIRNDGHLEIIPTIMDSHNL